MNRIFARILAIALCLGLCSVVQASPVEPPTSFTVTQTVVNPLYPELQDQAVPAEMDSVATQYQPNASAKKYVTIEEAAAQLEAALEKRQEVIYLYVDDRDFTDASILFALIGTHTGIPTQGEYISWSYRSYKSSITWNYREDGYYTHDVKLTMTYFHNAEQEKELTAKIDEVLDSLNLEKVPDDYHKLWVIYNYLSSHISYSRIYDDEDPYYLLQYSAYGALIHGKAVCQGIATLLYRMLLQAGIDNRLVSGWVWTGAHGWNIVKLGNQYYNTDLTNDLGRDEYRYFLRSMEFFKSHTRDHGYDTAEFHSRYPMSEDDYALKHPIDDRPWYTVLDPTCLDTGLKARFCLYCNVSESADIPALGHHNEWQFSTEATCEESGIIAYKCLRCGFESSRTGEKTKGHDYDLSVLQAPTAESEGMIREICVRCGHTQDSAVFKHDHYFVTWRKSLSCVNRSYQARECYVTNCPIEERYDYSEPLGHDWWDYRCQRCGSYREMPFNDVSSSDFFCSPVFWALDNNITSGTGPRSFSPNAACQRAQVVTFLWRAAGCPEPTITGNPFLDVTETDFYYKAVLWAVENGITNGLDRTHFGPFQSCNRAQVVTFLHRAMGKPEPFTTAHPFTDVDPSMFYYNAMLWAVENGITNGLSATTFGPNAICNRAQIVTFLYRAYE